MLHYSIGCVIIILTFLIESGTDGQMDGRINKNWTAENEQPDGQTERPNFDQTAKYLLAIVPTQYIIVFLVLI